MPIKGDASETHTCLAFYGPVDTSSGKCGWFDKCEEGVWSECEAWACILYSRGLRALEGAPPP